MAAAVLSVNSGIANAADPFGLAWHPFVSAPSLGPTETGISTRWGSRLDTRMSAWNAQNARGLHAAATFRATDWLSLDFTFATLAPRSAAGGPLYANERHATAGATVRAMRGWSASLHVRHFGPVRSNDEDTLRLRSSTTVGAQLTGKLSKTTRLSIEVFNLFDQRTGEIDYFSASRAWSQPGALESFLSHPAEARGFRLRLRTNF
ncbi:MAG TPA: TonB-dependent receptor [Usitatibacter sp.]|nr:TonB-dependent receptor [Usitatibacter sp.]